MNEQGGHSAQDKSNVSLSHRSCSFFFTCGGGTSGILLGVWLVQLPSPGKITRPNLCGGTCTLATACIMDGSPSSSWGP